jgi:glycosyltransferase involved in cell wall biosynthesis
MLKYLHCVVVCSRGRPKQVISIIESVIACENSSDVKIMIVLNGHSKDELDELRQKYKNQINQVEIIESVPGLAAARNVALKKADCEVLTFLDDDVSLPNGYFTAIDSAFYDDHELDGLSPRINGLYPKTHSRSVFKIKLRPRYGKVTKTGKNYWVPDTYGQEPTSVDWLPGCSMSYRFTSIKDMRFSEELMLGPTEGYSLGEDIDFSIQIPKLISLNTISVIHHQAESVRDVFHIMAKGRGRLIAYLAKKYPYKVSRGRALLTMFATCIYFGCRALGQWQSYGHYFINSCVQLQSYVSEFIDPILIGDVDVP